MSSVEAVGRSLCDWLLSGVVCMLPDTYPTIERFVRFAMDRGGVRLNDFMQMVWECVTNPPFHHLDCYGGEFQSDLEFEGRPLPVGVEHALSQYVIGAPARLLMAIIRRMASAFLRHGYLPAKELVACLHPVFGGARHLMHAVNSGGVGEFLTFVDMLGMVGLCRGVSHLRVFKILPSPVFRCGGTTMKMTAAKTWQPEEGGRRLREVVGHVITKEDAGDSRLLDVLPVFYLPQPRFAVTIHGLHAGMCAEVAAAMVGDGCRHICLSGTTVSRAYTFLLAAMRSSDGEVTVRSRSVLTLKLALTVKHVNEGHGARYALLQLVLGMFPCLTTLDVCGPNNPISTDPEFEARRIMTAPHGISPHLRLWWDPPVFETLQNLRWDLAEVNGRIFLHLLTGFKNLTHCSIGETTTLWKDRRNRIVRSIVLQNKKLASLEVSGPLACELPHIDALVMRVESTVDALPTIVPSTTLTVEARGGKRSDLTTLMRTHTRLAVRIYRCMDLDTTIGKSRKRSRVSSVGMFEFRGH